MAFLKFFKKNIPLQLLVAIALAVIVEPFLSHRLLSFFYTLSCMFKDLLLMAVPFVVFGYLMSAIVSFDKKSLGMIFMIFGMSTLSNFLCVALAYGISAVSLPFFNFEPLKLTDAHTQTLELLWALPWSLPITPGVAMCGALILGFMAVFFSVPWLKKLAFHVRDDATKVLRKGIIPFLPLYVFGFMLQLQYSGCFTALLQGYGKVFLLTVVVISSYVLLWYVVAARIQKRSLRQVLEAMLSSALTAFATMSSAATLPVTLGGVEKILRRRDYPDFVIPLTANIHTMGDALNIALSALALLWMTGQPLPSLEMYGMFCVYFCILKFSSAGVPGGGIIVMLPIIQEYLGFSPGLSSVLTTLYILQDPFITAMNVMGNGAFALITAPLFSKKDSHASAS